MGQKKKTMKFKWTILSSLFLAILILLIYFWEGIEEKKKKEELMARKVFSFNQERINSITIKSQKGIIFLSKGEDGTWSLIEPVKTKADSKVITGLINKLDEMYFSKAFNAIQKDFQNYGLLPPQAEVIFIEGNNKFSFALGEETPSVNSVYIKKGNENRVLLVESGLTRIILRDFFDFCDKTVINFDRREVNRIEFTYQDKLFVVSKDNQGWRLDKPVKSKAGNEEVDKIFDLLLGLRVQKFVDENTTDDKYYGFNKPRLKISLSFNDKKSESLVFGENKEGIFAKLDTEKKIYSVSGEIIDKIPKNSFDLRDKKLAPFLRDEVKSITLSSGEKSITIEKDPADKWVISKPEKAKANALEIENLLREILNFRMLEFVDNLMESFPSIGLQPPEKEIILKGRDNKHLVSIKVGKLDTNKYLCYAINDLENQVGMIDYTVVRDFLSFNLDKLMIKDFSKTGKNPSK